jgi:hypothetical protein
LKERGREREIEIHRKGLFYICCEEGDSMSREESQRANKMADMGAHIGEKEALK